MWIKNWPLPPSTSEEMLAWRIYTRCWKDVGMQAPGIWIMEWMKSEVETPYRLEAIFWYVNECKE